MNEEHGCKLVAANQMLASAGRIVCIPISKCFILLENLAKFKSWVPHDVSIGLQQRIPAGRQHGLDVTPSVVTGTCAQTCLFKLKKSGWTLGCMGSCELVFQGS